jgi:regulator of sigma E protease
MFIVNLIVFILVLGIIILIHEFGHFFFAKRAGILCHEFSIGMGPAVYQKRRGETIYSIRGIPIGGYVAMAGESVSDALIKKGQKIGLNKNEQGIVKEIVLTDRVESDVTGEVVAFDLYGKDLESLYIEIEAEDERIRYTVLRDAVYIISEKRKMWITPSEKSFESKTLMQRFLVIFAGPLMNFILAFILFFIIGFFVTKPNLDTNEIGSVSSGLPGDAIGLVAGSRIISVNGQDVSDWDDLSTVMASLDHVNTEISFAKDDQTTTEHVDLVVDILIAGIANAAVTDDGLVVYADEPIVGNARGRAATDGGLKTGDRITELAIDGVTYPITSWDDIIAFYRIHDRGNVEVTYVREERVIEGEYALISTDALNRLGYDSINYTIGISPTSQFDLVYTLSYPFESVYSNTMSVFQTIGLLFDRDEQLGVGDLSGPVGIFSLVSDTRSQGFLSLVSFTAFLSINIGLLNLLPIPALDGGRLVFLGIEGITRKPLNRKLENSVNNIMFFLLLALFIFVTYNDIIRLFRG